MSENTDCTPKNLYTDEMLSEINSRLKSRWIVLAAVVLPLLAVFIISLVQRTKWLSMVSAVAMGMFAIFWIDLFCVPWLRYRKLVTEALGGRSHTETLEFSRMEPDPCMVDGVPCRSLIFLGKPDKHGSREQLFYLDRNLPVPELEEGKSYAIKYTGRMIIGL